MSKKSGESSKKKDKGKKGKKGKEDESTGPVPWSFTKDRMEAIQSFPKSAIKAKIDAELAGLSKVFGERQNLAHAALKSPITLLGVEGSEAQGILSHKLPLLPVIDVCDRKSVKRCWRAIRMNFEPLDEDDDMGDDEPGLNDCGRLTLYGLSRWLNNRGETFPGGFPYDEVHPPY